MKYTLIISNTTTKEAYSYNLEEVAESSLYYKFRISVGDVQEGEWEWILIENPSQLDVVFNYNNPFKSKIAKKKYILVTYTDTLTNGSEILVVGEDGDLMRIKPLESGLMRIGDYREKKTQYDKQTKYISYDRKQQ